MILNKYKLQLVKESGTRYSEYDRNIDGPSTIANLLYELEIDKEVVEKMYLIMLDTRMNLIGLMKLATGTASMAIMDCRSIMQACLLSGATRFMLAHNHPSGDPSPSGADIESTRKVKQAGDLMGMYLEDHLIIGQDGNWTSLHKLGIL